MLKCQLRRFGWLREEKRLGFNLRPNLFWRLWKGNDEMENMQDRKYRYIKPEYPNDEAVEFDIYENSLLPDGAPAFKTCTVDAYNLIKLDGARPHLCEDGSAVTLNDQEVIAILKVIQKERHAIKYSGQPKTLKGWEESGYSLGDYLAIGDKVDESLADYLMNVVPPRSQSYGYLQIGEARKHVPAADGCHRAVYATFIQGDTAKWSFVGDCFANEAVNRVPERDPVAEAIERKSLRIANVDAYEMEM